MSRHPWRHSCLTVLTVVSISPCIPTVTAQRGDDPPGIGRPPGRTHLTPRSTRIPMSADGAMLVQINGSRPLKLFFDTGANAVILKPAVQQELQLPIVGPGTIGVRVRMDKLTVGELSLLDFVGTVPRLELAGHLPFDGVIGLTLFSDVTLVWVPGGGDLEIRKDTLPAGEPSLPFRRTSGGLVSLPVRMANHTVDAVLDVGSHFGIIVPTALANGLKLTVDATRTVPLRGPGIAATTGHPAVLDGSLEVGTLRVESPPVIVADIRLASGELLSAVNIGRPVLRATRLFIDQRSRRLRVEAVR